MLHLKIIKTANGNFVFQQNHEHPQVLSDGKIDIPQNRGIINYLSNVRGLPMMRYQFEREADFKVEAIPTLWEEWEKSWKPEEKDLSSYYDKLEGWREVIIEYYTPDFHRGGHKKRMQGVKVLAEYDAQAYEKAVKLISDENPQAYHFAKMEDTNIMYIGILTDEV